MKYLSRKFILATAFTLTGCGAFLFTTKLTGGEFVALAGLILGAFAGADVAINAITKGKAD